MARHRIRQAREQCRTVPSRATRGLSRQEALKRIAKTHPRRALKILNGYRLGGRRRVPEISGRPLMQTLEDIFEQKRQQAVDKAARSEAARKANIALFERMSLSWAATPSRWPARVMTRVGGSQGTNCVSLESTARHGAAGRTRHRRIGNSSEEASRPARRRATPRSHPRSAESGVGGRNEEQAPRAC